MDLREQVHLCGWHFRMKRLMHEMMEDYTDFLLQVLDKPYRATPPDYVIISEDMAYKTASMISPAMMREFMLPHYKRLTRFMKDSGTLAAVSLNGRCTPVKLNNPLLLPISKTSTVLISCH